MSGLVFISDNSLAEGEYKTVTGNVSVPSMVGESDYNEHVDSLAVYFVSDTHYAIGIVSGGSFSVELKVGDTYNVRCFNSSVSSTDAVFGGDEMTFIYYKNVTVTESFSNLDVELEKGTTALIDGNEYYIYENLGIATLKQIGVNYEVYEHYHKDEMVVGNTVIPAVDYDKYSVAEGQIITIPEIINVSEQEYSVVFVGTGIKSRSYTGSVIVPPELDNPSYTQYSNTTIRQGVYQNAETTHDLTIIFEGSVILNNQPFTNPFKQSTTTNTGKQLLFDITFEKDVFLNSFVYGSDKISAVYSPLMSIKSVSINGIYYGGLDNYRSPANSGDTIFSAGGGSNGASYPLANTGYDLITFSNNLELDNTNDLKKATINVLGVLPDSKYSVVSSDGGYTIKCNETIICNSVNSVVDNPITLKVVNGDSVTYSHVTKGSVLEDQVVPEGMEFCGWYRDSAFKQAYDQSEALNANTTVYVKYTPKEYNISIYGEGITVKNGDNVVVNGSRIAFGTSLNLAVEERVGYMVIVKMDGAVVSGTSINVPAKDFAISCERVAIPYVVKCMDGEAVVKTIDNCRLGDVITLPVVDKAGFTGWSVSNGMLLGAQYIVNYRDAGENDTITLIAFFAELQDTVWELTVTGGDGKAFWTKSNAIGSYGIVTVIPSEFEKASVSIDPAVVGAYLGKLSDNTYMVYSANGEDVTVAVAFQSVEKASEYTVSLVEIAKEGSPGFRATVAATDGGIVDTSGKLSIRYVYKAMDEASGLWCFTTSGQTTGVDDYVVPLGGANDRAYYVTGNFYLNSIEAADGAYLVYGYASYAFGDSSVTADSTVVTSPVIMSVSEIQAVVSKS